MIRQLSIITAFLGCTVLYGQSYQPLSNNLGWCVEQFFGLGSVPNDYVNKGDSTFLGKSYKVIKRFNSDTFLIREDTALRKTWFVNPSDSVEHLIYDFNLTTMDSVEIWFWNIGGVMFYVDSVYIISGRKNITLYTLDTILAKNLHWIEGIGSTYSPLYVYDRTFDNAGFCLICAYSSVGIQSYSGSCQIPCAGYPYQPCYSFIVGIDKENSEEKQIDISAYNDLVTITSSKSMIKNVLVYNSIGQLIHSQSSHSFKLEIDIRDRKSVV